MGPVSTAEVSSISISGCEIVTVKSNTFQWDTDDSCNGLESGMML